MAADDVGTALSSFGGAVSDLFGAKGASAAAGSYEEARTIALQNAQIAKQATRIKETQESRLIFKTIGAQKAAIGGAGFAESGTAKDLLAASASEAALTKALTAENGAIAENSYAEQAGLYGGMASAAKASGTAQQFGGLLNLAGGAISAGRALGLFGSSVGGDATAAGAAADAAAIASGDTAAGAAAGTATFGATAPVDIGGAVVEGATAEEGAGLIETLAEVAPEAAAAWIICTELHRQGRMPDRRYYGAASAFLAYPERGKRGYFVWAIPSVRHLRAHPQSRYSRLMEAVFNCRSQYICDRRRGRRGSIAGAIATHGLYALCWAISWFVPKSLARWSTLYEKPHV